MHGEAFAEAGAALDRQPSKDAAKPDQMRGSKVRRSYQPQREDHRYFMTRLDHPRQSGAGLPSKSKNDDLPGAKALASAAPSLDPQTQMNKKVQEHSVKIEKLRTIINKHHRTNHSPGTHQICKSFEMYDQKELGEGEDADKDDTEEDYENQGGTVRSG